MDTGWGREPYTIRNNFSEVKRSVTKSKEIENEPSYLPLGSNPAKDLLVMGPVVDIIMQSLDPGRLSTFSQFNTFRRS